MTPMEVDSGSQTTCTGFGVENYVCTGKNTWGFGPLFGEAENGKSDVMCCFPSPKHRQLSKGSVTPQIGHGGARPAILITSSRLNFRIWTLKKRVKVGFPALKRKPAPK
jgi:hypothetical protein